MHHTLALFDLDHTLLPLDSDQAWAHFFAKLGIDGSEQHAEEIDAYYQQYVAGTLDMNAYLDHTLAPLAKYSRAQLDAWHAQFMQEVISPAIRPAALNLVKQHLDAGDLCCIVTATNVFITAPIAKALGVTHLLGIELATEDMQPAARYTGKSSGVLSFREGKITRTEDWLGSLGHTLEGFENSYFYSDSINDLPLMERVTHPIATNPDKRLASIALERNWPILKIFD